MRDQQFLEYMVKEIVQYPDEVKTERTIDEKGVLITLAVHPDDMGRVIGKDGETARALRTMIRIVGAQEEAAVHLKILEPVRN